MSCLVDNAMVDDNGQVFFPDNPDDARYIEAEHHARPAAPDRWPWPCIAVIEGRVYDYGEIRAQCRRVAGHGGEHRAEVGWE